MSADETYTIKVSGPGTSCAVPVDASAVAMNVTIANPNAASYLTVFPAGVTVPLASSLNWTGGQAPTPNALTSDIGDGGQVSFYNKFGSVDVLADIVGYFVDHNHDDRYFTKTEINSKVAPGTLVLGPGAFAAGSNSGVTYSIDPSGGSINSVASALCFQAQASLPNGAVVTALRLDAFDSNANPMADVSAVMVVDPIGPAVPTQMASTTSAGINGTVAVSDVTIQSPGIDNTTRAYSVRMCMGSGMFFYDARIDYTTT